MAKSLLGQDDAPDDGESGERALPDGGDAFATALAFDGVRGGAPDAALNGAAARYLERQAKLVAIQTEHLHEQREVLLSTLRLKRLGDRLRLVTQFFVAAVTVGLFGLLVATLADAFLSHSVVVNAFSVPADLADRGITGQAVASGVLDALQQVQAATRGLAPDRMAEAAWTSDIKIELPDTGVSLGEVGRLLHQWLGHDVHIDGDVIATAPDRLLLTVRGAGVPARGFEGGIEGLGGLTTGAAEYVYGRSQPTQYAVYLDEAGRDEDALAFLPGAFARAGGDAQQVRLAIVWGNALDSLDRPAEAVVKYRLAMTLAPRHSANWWDGWANAIADVAQAEGEEAAWRESKALLAEATRAGVGAGPARNLLVNPAQFTWDLPLELSAYQADATRGNRQGSYALLDGPAIADIQAQLHDPAAANHTLALSDPTDAGTRAEAGLLAGYAALDAGRPAAAIAPLTQFYAIWQTVPAVRSAALDAPCFLALAEGLAGLRGASAALFAQLGGYARCRAFAGTVQAQAGDAAGAAAIWHAGLTATPDPPPIYLQRGLDEAARGDLTAAAADFAIAHAHAAHWADPLKAWGDVLLRQGRVRDALATYDTALTHAPNWADLRQARAMAAADVGGPAQGRQRP